MSLSCYFICLNKFICLVIVSIITEVLLLILFIEKFNFVFYGFYLPFVLWLH